MYAVIHTGGKQYRVEQGQTLLVERLPGDAGATVELPTLLTVGDDPVDGGTVKAEIVGHERGPKLRVVKFKPKRGYKRRTGHRQELTLIEVTSIKAGARAPARKPAAAKADGEPAAETAAKKPATRRPAAKKPGGAAAKPRTRRAPAKKKEDESDGS